MRTSLLNLIAFTLCLMLTGCPDPICNNPDPSYAFAVTAYFTPEQDSLKIGDTLYLVSEFPTTMVPVGGQKPVDYSNSKGIENSLGMVELTSSGIIATDAVPHFGYINKNKQIYNSKEIPNPNRFQQLQYEEKNGKYQLKVGFVPKKKGLYLFGIGSGLSNGKTEGDKCTKASFPTTIANTNQNLHHYEKWKGEPMEPGATVLSYLVKVY